MDFEKLLDALSPAEIAELIVALERRAAGAAQPASTAVAETPRGGRTEIFVAQLSTRVRTRLDAVRNAMAEKFGLDARELEVIPVPDADGREQPVVMLTSGNGLKCGSWNDIFGERDPSAFTIEVDGAVHDTRTGMTWIAYEAMIRELKARGVAALPDSSQVAEQNDQPWTCTLLTGDEMSNDRAPFAFVNEGKAGRSWGGRDYLGGLRFRPAVVVAAPRSR